MPEAIYPIVDLDTLRVKIQHYGSESVHLSGNLCQRLRQKGNASTVNGRIRSAKFWLSVLTELNNRGVRDILITCVDGSKSFIKVIELVFPQTIYSSALSIKPEIYYLYFL